MRSSLIYCKRPICQTCEFIASKPRAHLARPFTSLRLPARASSRTRLPQYPPCSSTKLSSKLQSLNKQARLVSYQADVLPIAEDELEAALSNMEELLESDTVPSEPETIDILQLFQVMAIELMGSVAQGPVSPVGSNNKQTPASALLSLDPQSQPPALSPAVSRAVDTISKACYEIMIHPNILIDQDVLKTYVRIQSLLRRPETFPEIFHLYATKLLAIPGTSPPRFQTPNPKNAKFAIPAPIAETALQTAIAVKGLPLAMEIIETSYGAPAFRRAKIIRKAIPPLAGAALAPAAAYTLAMQFAEFQDSMSSTTATSIAFVGIMTYLGAAATIGVVALTTTSHHMDRVTWMPGISLRQRWLREEERAAIDRLAQAFGFREISKRGEEEGPGWEALKYWAADRGMFLDRTDLMEGME
ncbi:hypothetical protein L228DRAFT_247904 [Xylona heveae TC161]|uniref:Uncharacterized protein n=1 Tax=Xylona heveae (strain CBS 132557 / TC161) TaxID=1328760 RepID=A0A165GJ81_XYLHT|nr:hypothetical protein L228DRAFT_247904 [Xylona heveae TC161]KZF22254.1 hypothetical protein L228DRAFT_247904 [Xylona heveae TC161]